MVKAAIVSSKRSAQPVTQTTQTALAASAASVQAKADAAEKPRQTGGLSDKQVAMVEGIKEAFRSIHDRDIKVSDKTILMIVDRAGAKWDDMDDDAKIEFLEKAETLAAQQAVSDPGLSILVKKLEQDEAAMAEIELDLTAIMRTKVNKVRLYAHFRKIFSKSELDAMPYPGTDKETSWLGNYKPDTTVKETNAGEIKVKWTDDFVSTMKRGKELDERLADLGVEDKATNASKWYQKWSKSDRNSEKSRLTSERNALRSMVRGAIEIHHVFEGIAGLPEVDIAWKRTADTKNFIAMPTQCGKGSPVEQVTTAPKCVYIQAKQDGQSGDVYTMSQLIAFDVQDAAANGGTLLALKNTVKKMPKGGAKGEEGDGSDMDGEQAYDTVNRFANYINKTANIAALRLVFASPKAEHHKDWIENLVTIGQWADIARKQFKSEIKRVTESQGGDDRDSESRDVA